LGKKEKNWGGGQPVKAQRTKTTPVLAQTGGPGGQWVSKGEGSKPEAIPRYSQVEHLGIVLGVGRKKRKRDHQGEGTCLVVNRVVMRGEKARPKLQKQRGEWGTGIPKKPGKQMI